MDRHQHQQQQQQQQKQQQQPRRRQKLPLYNLHNNNDRNKHCSSRTIWNQIGYIILLLFVLYMVLSKQQQQQRQVQVQLIMQQQQQVEQQFLWNHTRTITTPPPASSTATRSNPAASPVNVVLIGIWDILLYHKPSWRIFRSLLELNLCIIMISFSLYIYRTYLGIDITHQLLFQTPVVLYNSNNEPEPNKVSNNRERLYCSKNSKEDDTDDDNVRDNANDDDDDEVVILLDQYDDDLDSNGCKNNDKLKQNNEQQNNCSTQPLFMEYEDTETAEEQEEGEEQRLGQQQFKQHQLAEKNINREYRRMVSSSVPFSDNDNNYDVSTKLKHQPYVPVPLDILSIGLSMFLCILVALFGYTISSLGYFYFLFLLSSTSTSTSSTTSTSSLPTSTMTPIQNSMTQLLLYASQIAAPTFPLLLLLYFTIQTITVYPWIKKTIQWKQDLWNVLLRTIVAPSLSVTFRDGFIGDILTSTVRPIQDLVFTICYLLYGFHGWWSNYYYFNVSNNNNDSDSNSNAYDNMVLLNTNSDIRSYSSSDSFNRFHNNNTSTDNHNDDDFILLTSTTAHQQGLSTSSLSSSSSISSFIVTADDNVPIMEQSWLIYTLVLPACVISPLWWRFLQTIRQIYDHKQRWPYSGNSFKYFVAAQVAMIGIYLPSTKNTTWWLLVFVCTTLYQIYWDIFMDWNLFERQQEVYDETTSSLFLLFPSYRLRTKRLYPNRSIYWIICITNIILRFCWLLTFIPTTYLNSTNGMLLPVHEMIHNEHLFTPFIASVEIIRRTLWGLIRVEWESIKVSSVSILNRKNNHNSTQQQQEIPVSVEFINNQPQLQCDKNCELSIKTKFETKDMVPMTISTSVQKETYTTTNAWLDLRKRYHAPIWTNSMKTMDNIQILLELSMYVTIFALLGFVWAYHRETL